MPPYAENDFSQMVDEILEEYWRFSPSFATFAGIHKYDHELDHVDKETQKNFQNKLQNWLGILGKFKKDGGLSSDNYLDAEMLICNLEKDIISFNLFNRFDRDPSFYPSTAIFSCLIFTMRDFCPKEERYRLLTLRLKEIPRYLMEAKNNLSSAESIPKIWLEMAREITLSGRQFFTHLIMHTSGEILSLKNDILAAATLASKGFEDYLKFLEGELSAKPDGSFASGKEYFDFIMKRHHLLPYDSQDLEEIGLEYIEKTIREMQSVARSIDPSKNWEEIISDIKRDAPSPDLLLEHYRQEIRRTKNFIIERDLITIPENETLDVIETPLSERPTLPYAAYMAPAPFEDNQRGLFWVTPVDSDSPERAAEQMAGHSKAAVEVRALHEGYPGHHLQLCIANRLNSKVRRVFGTTVFVEGWALYCEELMKQLGYYTGRRTELIQLKDQLWRACRVLIDARLHTGKLDFESAVDLLINTAKIERYNAEAEVRRYSQTPSQPMSYLIGKIEIMRFAGEYRKRFPNLPLKAFHNRLLSYGSIPISLLRSAILGTNH